MGRLKHTVLPIVVLVGFAVSLWFLFRSRASLRERDEQVHRLRERLAQFEEDAAHRSSMDAIGLAPDELKAYLSLPYEEFDAMPGSGHRRFRDQPRDPAQAGALIEAYLDCHPELPLNQRTNLQGHAA